MSRTYFSRKDDFHGIALLCNRNGRIEQVIRNTLNLHSVPAEGASIREIIDESSLEKFNNFKSVLDKDKALSNWEINVKTHEGIEAFHFVGGAVDGRYLIVASASVSDADFYYHELIKMNNEQTDLLRSSIKKNSNFRHFEELSEMNNELANLQRDLYKKNSQLQKVIEARDKYLGMAAHDFRNPLGGINNVCSILLDEEVGPLTDEQREFIELIFESSTHLLSIVEDMLDYSTIEAGRLELQKEEADMLELLKKTVAFNTPSARKKDITIYLSASLDGTRVFLFDRKKITQVLDNLISNAIKFSHTQTAITISMKITDGKIIISVQDEGQGIPEPELRYLFTPFQRPRVNATNGEKSSGLGLAICKRIVEAHEGSIWVESTPGQGSVFSFSLPVL